VIKKWSQKNMKECDNRKSHVSNKLHLIYISSNNVWHPCTKTFTTLHPTTLNSTSLHLLTLHFLSFKLHPLHFTTLLFGLTPVKFPTAPFHLTSLHCTFRWFSPHFYSFHFTPFIIAYLTLFQKILGLQRKVPNALAGSWFQFLTL